MFRFLVLAAALLITALPVSGQQLAWEIEGEIPSKVLDDLPVTSENLEATISSALETLQNSGFLLARISNIQQDSSIVTIYLDTGEQYRWAILSGGNLPVKIMNRVGFRPGRYDLSPVSKNQLESLFGSIIRESERSGYPYARVGLDSVRLMGNEVYAAIQYDQGDQVTYGRVVLSDSSFTNPSWISAYLDVRPGEIYDQRTLDRLEVRLEALDFIRLELPPSVIFQENRADISLDVEKVPANRFDAIIGFLPNEEAGGGLRITGEAELHLDNLFRSGKMFDLHWQRMRPETQFLQIGYFHPNLLRSNLNVGLGFQLLKEDSTFTTRDFDIRLDYRSGRNIFSVLTRFRAARLLDVSEDQQIQAELADFNLNEYGLAYTLDGIKSGWLGYRGIKLGLDARIGSKNIRRNASLPDDFYTDLEGSLLQWGANFLSSYGFLTGRQTLLYQQVDAGWMDSDQLFLNDLYRLGGFNSIRGFNENQFFAQRFIRYSLEWQLYFDESSHIMAFVDQAFYRSIDRSDEPTGIGIGLTLRTGGGLLQLAYALGRTRDQSFDLRLSKFHFGYKAKF